MIRLSYGLNYETKFSDMFFRHVFQTNMSRQTVQMQIRLLLKEQPDQGLHCLPLHLRILSLSEFLDMLNKSCGAVQGKLKLWGTSCFCLLILDLSIFSKSFDSRTFVI